jgi:hypothetical protein
MESWRWAEHNGIDILEAHANCEPAGQWQIVLTISGNGHRPKIRDRKLIAAAPDLLQACKMALATLTSDDGGEYGETIIADLQAAIAKSETT